MMPQTDSRTAPAQGERGLHILLVEDDAALNLLLADALCSAGHTVTSACTVADALRVSACMHFDMLITDLVMPGVGGVELTDRIRSNQGPIAVIYMSGYADGPIGSLVPEAKFLRKPFSPQKLLSEIRKGLH